jgi:hypothetical protein
MTDTQARPRVKANRSSLVIRLLRPVNALVLAAGLAVGVLLAALTTQPPLVASAQTPPTTPAPWCGDGTCNGDYGEAPYNCSDCLTTCEGANWCTDGVGASPSGCPDYTPSTTGPTCRM